MRKFKFIKGQYLGKCVFPNCEHSSRYFTLMGDPLRITFVCEKHRKLLKKINRGKYHRRSF